MPGTKDELRAEVASLREELAAERAKVEVLREQAGAHVCWHMNWAYPLPAAAPQPAYYTPQVICGSETNAPPLNVMGTSVAAGCAGAGISTYTLLS